MSLFLLSSLTKSWKDCDFSIAAILLSILYFITLIFASKYAFKIYKDATITHRTMKSCLLAILIINCATRITFFVGWVVDGPTCYPTMYQDDTKWVSYFSNVPAVFFVCAFSILVTSFAGVYYRHVSDNPNAMFRFTIIRVIIIIVNVGIFGILGATLIAMSIQVRDHSTQMVLMNFVTVTSSLMAFLFLYYGIVLYVAVGKIVNANNPSIKTKEVEPAKPVNIVAKVVSNPFVNRNSVTTPRHSSTLSIDSNSFGSNNLSSSNLSNTINYQNAHNPHNSLNSTQNSQLMLNTSNLTNVTNASDSSTNTDIMETGSNQGNNYSSNKYRIHMSTLPSSKKNMKNNTSSLTLHNTPHTPQSSHNVLLSGHKDKKEQMHKLLVNGPTSSTYDNGSFRSNSSPGLVSNQFGSLRGSRSGTNVEGNNSCLSSHSQTHPHTQPKENTLLLNTHFQHGENMTSHLIDPNTVPQGNYFLDNQFSRVHSSLGDPSLGVNNMNNYQDEESAAPISNPMYNMYIISIISAVCFIGRVIIMSAMNFFSLRQGPFLVIFYSLISEIVPVHLILRVFNDSSINYTKMKESENTRNLKSYGKTPHSGRNSTLKKNTPNHASLHTNEYVPPLIDSISEDRSML